MTHQTLTKLALAALLSYSTFSAAGAFFGAGAAFPKAAYLAWGKAYQAQSGSVLIYTTVGSGKGLAEILASRTDFGASDKPFSKTDLDQYNLMQFPTLIGGIVPTINLKGIADNQLQLDGATLAAIYLGKITHWNDAAISALNPSLNLPNERIAVIHRSDKSGATFNFSNYLSKVSPEWKVSMGEGLLLDWKTGLEVDSSEAMLQKVLATPNSLGYADFASMEKRHVHAVRLKNLDGQMVAADVNSFTAAASAAKWTASNGFNESLTNQSGQQSWPITSATFVVLERAPSVPENVAEMLKFFDWAYRNGDAIALALGYVPLPDSVADLVRSAWQSEIKNRAGQALFKSF